MNIVDVIARHAAAQPHAMAILNSKRNLSYHELMAAVNNAARQLSARGVCTGQLVSLTMRGTPLNLILTLALARLGAISVSLTHGSGAQRRAQLAARLCVSHALHDGETKPFEREGTQFIQAAPSLLEPRPEQALPEPNDSVGLPCRVALSSGTTGMPKAILWTHDRLLLQANLQTGVYGQIGHRLLLFIDLNTAAGLNPAVRQLLAGCTVVLMDPFTPAVVHQTVNIYGCDEVRTSPALLAKVLENLPDGQQRWPSVKRLVVSGGSMNAALRRKAMSRLTSHVVSSYGSTETGLTVFADTDTLRRHPQAAGYLVPLVEAQAVNGQHERLAAGEIGILRFRGLGFPTEYFQDPQATEAHFRDGWFYPGDSGRVLPSGLVILGARVGDVINMQGTKVNLAEVDRALESAPGVHEAASFAMTDTGGLLKLMAAVVMEPGALLDEAALKKLCAERVGKSGVPKGFVVLERLPRNEAGKLLRAQLSGIPPAPAAADNLH